MRSRDSFTKPSTPAPSLLLLAWMFAGPLTAPAQEVPALDSLRAEWTAAYEAGDAAAMEDLYTPHAVRMPYDAPAVEGRDAIIDAYRAQFAARSLRPRIVLSPDDVLRLDNLIVERDELRTDHVAIERGRYDEQWSAPDGTVRIHELGKYVAVARRGPDSRWRFMVSIFNRDAAPEVPGGRSDR